MALFKKDKLIGYLSSDESKYYLISVGKLKGGIITINTKLNSDDTDSQNLSLEIKRIRVSSKYTSTDVDDLKVKITASVDVTIGELKDQKEKLTEEDIVRLREEASSAIKDRMENVIKKIQNEYNTDVLGYGDILYRFHLKTWKNVKDDFEEKFVDISTDVECNVKIYNTGFIR